MPTSPWPQQEPARSARYDEARESVGEVLQEDPENVLAKRELGYLDDPIRTNPALDYKHTQNVDKVRRGLYTGEGRFNLGKFDHAKTEFEKVLRDRPLQQGRPPLAGTRRRRQDATITAPPTTRPAPNCSVQVDAAWELSVPPRRPGARRRRRRPPARHARRQLHPPETQHDRHPGRRFRGHLGRGSHRLPAHAFDRTRHAGTRPDPQGRQLRDPQAASRAAAAAGGDAGVEPVPTAASASASAPKPAPLRINELRLRNVPLATALKYICDATSLRYKRR